MLIPENRSKLFYGIDFEDFFSGNSESDVLQEDENLSDLKRHSASRFNNQASFSRFLILMNGA